MSRTPAVPRFHAVLSERFLENQHGHDSKLVVRNLSQSSLVTIFVSCLLVLTFFYLSKLSLRVLVISVQFIHRKKYYELENMNRVSIEFYNQLAFYHECYSLMGYGTIYSV